MKKDFEHHKERWRKMAKLWGLYSYYSRPSKEDEKNFRHQLNIALKNKVKPKIVLLGATPELRDILFEFSKKQEAEVYCVDMTRDMYMAMSHHTKKKNPNEKFINCNWLGIPKKIESGSIDVVAGDFVIGNVGSYEHKFMKGISSVLKPDGYFVTRAYYRTNKVRKISNFKKEIERLAQNVSKGKYSAKKAKDYFMNNILYSTWYWRNDNQVSLAYRENEFLELRKKRNTLGRTERKILDLFWEAWWALKDKYWSDLPKKDLENIIKKYFIIKGALFSKDYERSEFCPIYLLQKKP